MLPLNEAVTPGEAGRPSRLATAKDCFDILSKAVPLLAGAIYLAGYVVIAIHLTKYNVPLTQLVSARYFIAGLPPFVLLCLFGAVGYSAYRYNPRVDGGKMQSRVGFLALGLFVAAIVIEVVGKQIRLGAWFNLYLATLCSAALGQAAFWYFVAGVRTRLFVGMKTYFRAQGRDASDAYWFAVYIVLMAIAGAASSFSAMARVYTALPQAYGGGRPLRVQLYVERDKIPAELLASRPAGETAALVQTVPVELILQTSEAVVVDTLDTGPRRVWTVDARIVHAVLMSPTR